MKKFFAMALTVIMMMAMAVPTFAGVAGPEYTITIYSDETASSALQLDDTIAAGDKITIKMYTTIPTSGRDIQFSINVPEFMSVDSATFDKGTLTEADYALSEGVLSGTITDTTSQWGNILIYLTVENVPAEGASFAIADFSPVVAYASSGNFVTMTNVTWNTDNTLVLSANAGDEAFTAVNDTDDSDNGETGEGDTDEGDPETPSAVGTLTGQTDTETGVTFSQWAEGSALELDTDYTIAVIGKLDSDGDGTADDTDEVEDPYIDVRIYWTDMVFNYTYQWDKDNLVDIWYWEDGEDNIKVENWSNVNIDAGISFAGDGEYADTAVEFAERDLIGATWSGSVLNLVHGNQSTVEGEVIAPSGTLDVSVADGVTMTTGDDADKEVTLGYITVNVAIAGDAGTDDSTDDSTEPETTSILNMENVESSYAFDVKAGETLYIYIEDTDGNSTSYSETEWVDWVQSFIIYDGATELSADTDYTRDGYKLTINESHADKSLTLRISSDAISTAALEYPLDFDITITLNVY